MPNTCYGIQTGLTIGDNVIYFREPFALQSRKIELMGEEIEIKSIAFVTRSMIYFVASKQNDQD